MPQLTSVSCNPTSTQTSHDVPLPTRQERLTALLDALKHQQDHRINQLLHAIRRDPYPDMAGVVGEVYFEADERQQLAIDIWSEHLSADQRFMFSCMKEDTRSMGFSKLLSVALERQHDTLLDVLLKGARELDQLRLLRLIGMHYPDASKEQKTTIDMWRATLTQDQALAASSRRLLEHHLKETLTFLNGDDLTALKVVSRGLKQTIEQDPKLRERTLSNRITGFSSAPSDLRLELEDALLQEISEQEERHQVAKLKELVVAIAKVKDGSPLKETEKLFAHLNSMKSMAARASVMETVGEHLNSLKSGRHYAEERMRDEENETVVVPGFLNCLDLLDPPKLRIRPLLATARQGGMALDMDNWGRFSASILALRIADVPREQLHEWLDVLRFFSRYLPDPATIRNELELEINARHNRNALSRSEQLELLSMLLHIDGFSAGNERLIREVLVPALVPGQSLDVVAAHVADCVCDAQSGHHLAALVDYIESAPAGRRTEMSVMLAEKLYRYIGDAMQGYDRDPEELSQFFLASVRLLSHLPNESRLDLARQSIDLFRSALQSTRETYQTVRALPHHDKLEIMLQLRNALNGLEESSYLKRTRRLFLEEIHAVLEKR